MSKQIDKAFVSFRIGVPRWIGDKQFEGLIELFEKNKGVTDEITFFPSIIHSPIPLEHIKKNCDLLKPKMQRCRELGYSAGINILCTIGHKAEGMDLALKGDYYNLTDSQGVVSPGTYCPNDERYLEEYVKPLYIYLCQADPNYIWIDDDVRLMGHYPVLETCFCDNCLKIFSQKMGKEYTRELLNEDFNRNDEDRKLNIRKAWLDHTRQTITSLLELIEHTVHSENPAIALGFMDGARFYEGLGLEEWAKALGSNSREDVMWRPGGGNYNEESPSGMFDKAHAMGIEAAMLPQSVKIIESELESFPYSLLTKSTHCTALEANIYVAAGSTGTAFNVLSPGDEPIGDYQGLVEKLNDNRPFHDLLARSFGRSRRQGVFSGSNKYSFASWNFSTDWFRGTAPGGSASQLYMGGLPAAYALEGAAVTTLTSDSIIAFDEEQIKTILSGGIYIDGGALERLNKMGYGRLTGFKITSVRNVDTIEKLNAHDLNGIHEGFMRDARQSFFRIPAYCLEPSAGAQTLSHALDYSYDKIEDCCSGVFENELGGRVCVAGYCPWEHLYFVPKMAQIKNIFRWLSKDELAAYVFSYHRISMWDSLVEGKHVTALVNGYMDPAENVELMLKSNSSRFEVIDMNCNRQVLESSPASPGYQTITIPSIAPWHMVLVRQV